VLILLPPSEGKIEPARGGPLGLQRLAFPVLEPARAEVLRALVDLCTADGPGGVARAAGVLGVGRSQTGEVLRNARLEQAPTGCASTVYNGVLYEALGLGSLTGTAKRRAGRWLAITSALFGLVRPQDPIPAYRLSGGVRLPEVGNVATFWRRHLDPAVREAVGRGLVMDLRSSTYASFWRPDADLAARTVTVRVLHEVGGRRTVVSHFNKATKGRIVRALLQADGTPDSPAALADRLGDLGWKIDHGGTGRHGTALDVVVTEL
jgi:cytoplasmic iron level regulating protein YaaA (DUF328/UPF0246 family)